MTMTDPTRIPVIIGVGQVNDRPEDPDLGLDSLGLMVAALRAAEADAGGDILTNLDSLAIVDQISFRDLGNLCAPLAQAIGANPKVNYQSEAPHGDTPIRLLTTANDVIHSWAVPAFWMKLDAVPGRINELSFEVDKTGVYYGQCSELCGIKHGYMPIAVEVVSKEDFATWVKAKGGTMPGEAKAEQVAAAPAAAAPAASAPAATAPATK